MLEILLFSDHWVQAFDVRKEMICWKSCVSWEHRIFGRKNRKKGSSEHSQWYVCRCCGGLMTGLDLVPKTQVWSLMECWLHRDLCCRENMFLSIRSLFILLGKEAMSWPHQKHLNTKPQLSKGLIDLWFVNGAEVVSIHIYWWNQSRVISEPPGSFTKRIFSQGTQ